MVGEGQWFAQPPPGGTHVVTRTLHLKYLKIILHVVYTPEEQASALSIYNHHSGMFHSIREISLWITKRVFECEIHVAVRTTISCRFHHKLSIYQHCHKIKLSINTVFLLFTIQINEQNYKQFTRKHLNEKHVFSTEFNTRLAVHIARMDMKKYI